MIKVCANCESNFKANRDRAKFFEIEGKKIILSFFKKSCKNIWLVR